MQIDCKTYARINVRLYDFCKDNSLIKLKKDEGYVCTFRVIKMYYAKLKKKYFATTSYVIAKLSAYVKMQIRI